MLTQNSLKIVSFLFWQATLLRLLPYTWNARQFLFTPVSSTSKARFLQTLAPCLWVWSYAAFIWVEYFRNKEMFGRKENRVRGMLQLDYGMAYGLISVVIYNTMKRRHQIAILVNQFFYFVKELDDKVVPERRKRKLDLCELALASIFLCIYGHSFVGALFFLEDPTSPRYLYSLVGEQYRSIWMLLLFMGVEYGTYVIQWQFVMLLGVIVLCYLICVNSWLREMHCKKGGAETGGLMRNPKYSFPVYCSFQVLSQGFKFCFSSMMLPWLNFFIVAIPVVTNTFLIRFHHQMSPIALLASVIVSLACMISLLIIYPRAASVHTLSLSYLKSLSHWMERRGSRARGAGTVTKKDVKACFPLKVKYGVFGFIQRFTTLKLIGVIFYWTMKSLLMTRKK